MSTDKLLFWTVISMFTGYASTWVFNHVNAWLGFLIFGIYLYFVINFIKKQFKIK
jgi:hypothetical protein